MQLPSSISFGSLVRAVGDEARRHGLKMPAFAAPPRTPGLDRAIRTMRGGGLLVTVRVRGRTPDAVVTDVVEGVIVANGLTGRAAEGWRLALRAALAGGEARAA